MEHPCSAINQRQLEVNVCGTTVVVPIGYSYIRLYFYISRIPPAFGQELNARGEETAMAQTGIIAICNENEHPAGFQPLLGKKGESKPLRIHVDKLLLPQVSCGTGEKKK